ncbi:MAG: UbiA family prenyltransferase [Euryarchaeota archaeon]|jgi:4-hydroxybenzoate polyprenyltransferase|nr:UbiA family prenyltransferase [Euryarchaeota archaeon]HHT18785.1 UbiA family prenyltransferase [Methanobacterium sp.]
MTRLSGVTSYLNIIETSLRNSSYEFLRRFFIIISSSSLFIAISGCFKTYLSFSLYNTPQIYPLLFTTFLVIYSVYGLNKITDIKEDQLNNPERTSFILKYKPLFKYSAGLTYFLAVLIGCFYGWKVLLIILFPLLAGIMYSKKLHPNIPRLKNIFPVKSIIVALSWTVGNTFLPIVNGKTSFQVMLFIFYFFFIKSFINTVLFDLIDYQGDKVIGVQTIPVVVGPERTILLLLFLNSTMSILILICVSYGLFKPLTLPLIFCLIYCYLYIIYFYKTNNRLRMELLVDGEWIFLVFISLATYTSIQYL